MDKELDKLINEGILTPVETSEWATPLVAVRKEDGNLRLCGDYRSTVNKYLEETRYPLPTPVEIYAKIQGGERYTKLDLNRSYNQFELDDKAKQILRWSTHRGIFTMERLPFGITIASSEFQKYIEQLFIGVNSTTNFLDDIIITGKDNKTHLENLEKVLKILSDAGLTVKKEKCNFFQSEIKYLGYIINKESLKNDNSKVQPILNAKIQQI